MNIIGKVVQEWSWRCRKGYPDLDSQEDLEVLKEYLQNLGLDSPIVENIYNALKFGDLNKPGREYRAGVIADKIANKEPFLLQNQTEKTLEFTDPEYMEIFKSEDVLKIKEIGGVRVNNFKFFKDSTGKEYGLGDLKKDVKFGGKGKGSGTVVEDRALAALQRQIDKAVEEENGPIRIEVGGKIYEDITQAKTQPGHPKSDFNLYNSNGEPVVFISHKKSGRSGPSPKDFIRWGGYTQYKDHPEVQQFRQALENFLQENDLERLPSSTAFIKEIKDDELVLKIVYGHDYGKGFGINNVQIIMQGTVTLEPTQSSSTYKLTSPHTLINGQLPENDYRPLLSGKYRSDREMFGIPTLEAIAQPSPVAIQSTNVYRLEKGEFVKVK